MNNYEFKEMGDEPFDPNILAGDVSFTQAQFYGDWQKGLGRAVKRFSVFKSNDVVAYFQIIRYGLTKKRGYFYIPYGPITKDFSDEFFSALKIKLTKLAQENAAAFVRLDFTPHIENNILSRFFTASHLYTYHSAYFQPRYEWYLDLSQTEFLLLKNMHEKTRYSIRLAEKREVISDIVTTNFDQYFERFYELMAGTAERNGFNIHDRAYYEGVFKSLESTPNAFLSISRYNQNILAIDIIIVFGKTANYVFGASSNDERNRMPTYAAQWKAICHAKEIGCLNYNFGGIAAENSIYTGWEGLTAFKKKFGGREVRHSDFFDIIVMPFWYFAYNFRKKIKKIRS